MGAMCYCISFVPHDSVVSRVTMKCRSPVEVKNGTWEMSSEEVMLFTNSYRALLVLALELKFHT